MRRAWKAALGNALPSPDDYVKVIVVADSGLETASNTCVRRSMAVPWMITVKGMRY